MSNNQHACLLQKIENGVLTLTLNRPHVKNAMNLEMVASLRAALHSAVNNNSIRAIVIRGTDGTFCAGGDISDMKNGAGEADAVVGTNRAFGTLLEEAQEFPKLIVTVLEGAALGGGFGLACISDIAIAEEKCRFGMPEVTLGLIPAQIAPFVLKRIGLTQTRHLALSGEMFAADKALSLGLIHYAEAGTDALECRLQKVLSQVHRTAPNAVAATKMLLLSDATIVSKQTLDTAAELFADALLSGEGQEGTAAFREKRAPTWVEGCL